MTGILVLGELTGSVLQSTTCELLAAGRKLSDCLGAEVAVALLGSNLGSAYTEAISYGADTVYVVEDPLLEESQVDAQLAAFEQLCRQIEPNVILVGKTLAGSNIGPRLAFRLGVSMAQDCLDIDVDPQTKRVVATRPVYGGSAMAKVTFPDADPQVVLLRAKAYEALVADPVRKGKLVNFQVSIDPSVINTRLVKTVKGESEGVKLEDARVVVGGGRGLGGPEPFELLHELASILGGTIGASRAVCDAGWIDHSYQIGLTGKTVSPDLYITIGISGASQHMAGCSGAKNIVAINRDADANIFKEAAYGVAGEWKNVLPSFIETVRELVQT